ncbi:MAG: hypothetical protein ABJA98_09475 [Acidobacteriota bacterium]
MKDFGSYYLCRWRVVDGFAMSVLSFRTGLNNNGQIAFIAQLADGRTGVYRADPERHGTVDRPDRHTATHPAKIADELCFPRESKKRKKRRRINDAEIFDVFPWWLPRWPRS